MIDQMALGVSDYHYSDSPGVCPYQIVFFSELTDFCDGIEQR